MDKNIFENGWDEINSYIFGFIMADGCLCKHGRNKNRLIVNITSCDYDIMNKMHKYMCVGNKLYEEYDENEKHSVAYSLIFRNEESIGFMIKNGLTERKSLTCKFPSNIPDKLLPHFVRGFFDGDGSIVLTTNKYNTYGTVSFTSASVDFLLSLQEIMKNNYDIKSTLYDSGHKNAKAKSLRITSRSKVLKFYDIMYKDATIYLERKRNKFVILQSHQYKYNKYNNK